MSSAIMPGSGLSGEQFAAAMEHSPIGTAIVGLDGRWLWTNLAISNMLGYCREELAGLGFQDITHPDDLDSDLDQLDKLIRGEIGAYQMEKRYLRKDGLALWCMLTVALIRRADGSPDYFISKIQDVSQRKADEAENEALTERLTLATRGGGIGVWEWDIASGALIWDARMFELYGIDPSIQPTYETFINSVAPEHRDRIGEALSMAADGIQPYDTEFPILTEGGERRQLRALATVVRDRSGRASRMIGTNWDVTQHRELVTMAEASARAKSEFLATMSHELRTPLNSIIGFAKLARDGTEDGAIDPNARRYVGLIHDASTALLAVVNDVLDYSRIESGGFELDPHPFDLRDLIDGVIEVMQATTEAKGLTVQLVMGESNQDQLIGDSARLRQILFNLLSNGIKFTAEGGIKVTVDTIIVESGRCQLEISVSDSGIGIAPDMRDRLFKRFSQVDQSIGRRYGGTGLGLAICHRLVTAMGGSIDVESEAGGGSRFYFAVELERLQGKARTEAKSPARAAASAFASRHILLAEDVELNQMLAVALLTRAGHTVEVVSNGVAAVQAVRQGHYDLVLMDMQMPEMDGLAATRAIRSLGPNYQRLPVLAMTANVLPDQVARCFAAGMDDHIAKPIDPSLLMEMIDHWCVAKADNHAAQLATG